PRPAAPPPGRSPAWSCRRPSGCPPPPTADRAPSSGGDGSGWHPALLDALWSLAVKKTSVYLPEALKERLATVARATGRSEAQLLRRGGERRGGVLPAGTAPHAPAR